MKSILLNEKTLLLLGLFFLNTLIASDYHPANRLNTQDLFTNNYNPQNSWNYFKNEHAFKNVFLVFAGPYPTSPSSTFGHLFLLLEPVQSNDKPMLLWDSINFSANVQGINSFVKYYKGIFGGLVGYYQIMPFYEKLREYTFIESRPIWIFPLILDTIEKDLLLYYLYQEYYKKYNYKFHQTNCASKIESIINKSINKNITENPLITSPRLVIMNLNERLMIPYFIDSTENTLKSKKSNKIIKFDSEFSSENKNIPIKSEASILLKILEWKYFQRNTLLNNDEQKLLEDLRIMASESETSNNIELVKQKKLFRIHAPVKYGIGTQSGIHNDHELGFQFRLGLHEFSDNYDVYPKYDFITLMKVRMAIRKDHIILNELWLFDQLSLNPNNVISSYISWRFGLGLVRIADGNNEYLSKGMYWGIGKTISPINEKTSFSFLINLNTIFEEKNDYSMYFVPELTTLLFFNKILKMNLAISSSQNISKNSQAKTFFKTNIVIDLDSEYQLDFNSIGSSIGLSFHLYLLKYFN